MELPCSMQIIEWLRLMSLDTLQTVDLSDNLIAGDGFFNIIAWLISIPPELLYQRPEVLVIDLRGNKVSMSMLLYGVFHACLNSWLSRL